MLKEQLTELINTLYEAEGLVDMALRRDVATDDRVLYLALAKCHEVSRKAAEINIDKPAETAEGENPVYSSAPEPAVPAPDETAHEAEALNDEEPEKEVEVFTNEVLPHITAASSAVDDISDASIFDNDDDGDEAATEMEGAPDTNTGADTAPEADYAVTATGRVETAGRKPIIRAFSINDKYRYRRTLFEDNDLLMRDTLAEFEAMAGFDEAVDYCVQALGWDVDSGEAKGFVAILDKYYRTCL